MHFHSPGRTGGNAEPAGDTLIVIEKYQPCLRVNLEGARRANGDTGAATGTPVFVADDVLAERLYFYTRFNKKIDTLIIFLLVSLQFQYQQSLLFRCN